MAITATAADLEQPPESSTRERILDIALDLFIEKGFEKTSLREIAEQLGFSKAALYYHFASKNDILMALHMRLHEFSRDAMKSIIDQEPSVELWAGALELMIDFLLANRKIFLLHERNPAAIEQVHHESHDSDHEDMEAQLKLVLSDGRLSLEDRVRMSCAFGAVMAGLFLGGDAFVAVPTDELRDLLRGAVQDLLGTH